MEAKYKVGQKVVLHILRETPLGFVAKINATDEGLLYHNELFEQLEKGDERDGYIKRVRTNGQIDLQLNAFGNLGSDELGDSILEAIRHHGGKLEINDKTPAEKIYELFGVSKKKYKMALGALYKKRLIKMNDHGIELAKPD